MPGLNAPDLRKTLMEVVSFPPRYRGYNPRASAPPGDVGARCP